LLTLLSVILLTEDFLTGFLFYNLILIAEKEVID